MIILTATQRLSLFWQQEFAQRSGSKPCVARNLYSFSSFIKMLCDQLSLCNNEQAPSLISANTELAWWEDKLIKLPNTLLSLRETAKQAMRAFSALKSWRINLNVLENYLHNEEQSVFYSWAVDFEKELRANNWMLEVELIDYLTSSEKNIKNLLKILMLYTDEKKIQLAGFDELTPQLNCFLKVLEDSGWSIEQLKPKRKTQNFIRKKYKDPVQEILAMAKFAKEKAACGKKVGIISLSLEKQWGDYQYWFKQIFHFDNWLDPKGAISLNFNLAFGLAMDQYAIIQSALSLLEFGASGNYLRYSPYLVLKEEETKHTGITDLASRLEWWGLFEEILKQAQWPNPRSSLSSYDYQVLQKFEELIASWLLIDKLGILLSKEQALSEIKDLCAEMTFQPQSVLTKVHILGLLESGGMDFDYIWLSGFSEENWPPKPAPNPFLSLALQEKFQLANASFLRQEKYAGLVLDRLLHSADNCIMSIADPDKERPASFSMMLPFAELEQDFNFRPISFEVAPIELMPNSMTPWYKSSEEPVLRGITTLLNLQAACPFKAFGVRGLKLKSNEAMQWGLSALEKGSVVHKALEFFWKEIFSLEKLKNTNFIERRKMLQNALLLALPDSPAPLIAIERFRLLRLLEHYLSLEEKREDFSCVALEKVLSVELLGYHFKLRIDREDLLATGERVIIDYKTGKVADRYLIEDPAFKPQLALYALATKSRALIYAHIIEPSPIWSGICEEAGLISSDFKGIKSLGNLKPEWSWEELLIYWRKKLEEKLAEYLSGINTVNPKEGKKTCEQCHLQDLCRYEFKE
jgi:ATP-dependent helicase/nuclease subunit B